MQINALIIYNGGLTSNDGEVYVAKKPEFIKLFAGFIAINCLGSGMVWILYACIPSFCHGIKFKLFIFVLDQCADVFYSVFPFIIIIYDTYNDQHHDGYDILLGQLNTESALTFLASFIPLILLCHKCLLISKASTTKMRDNWNNKWFTMNQIMSN